MEELMSYLYIIPAMLVAVVLHELAHGLVSYWLGDPTPKETGRLSLNPLKHIDPIGILCLLLFRVGWAKPVLINPEYYKHRRLGTFLVAIAGPFTNYIIAFVAIFFYALTYKLAISGLLNFVNENVFTIIINFFLYMSLINIGLGTFNLIPIPPLDGSRILGSFFSENVRRGYMRFERYGMFVILGLLLLDNVVARITGNSPLMSIAIQTIFEFFANLALAIFGL